ncbi:sulfite exporter TauE/SafE family protein [Aeromicrobium sp. 9AM]|uniref:sulfite exporter TauE/SafE family protein n=1 Tax=Aeromicrobium sp. 9AM TaxID=2653126 RepID=UPI0012F1BE06|nr:sulfite exporter TauE/SafE family protein [Aeromicrobium sp. 9AM]VXC46124.1 putative membrane transporter protein [Aeromicrobium sp. 9AM]
MLEAIAIFAAGMWAGMINVIVGSGTLITFPTLLLFGYPAITANVSNNIGLVAGGLSGVHGYRKEALRHRALLLRLAPASVLGALTGAILLLVLPADSFKSVVPVLITIGLIMVMIGPAMQRRTARRHATLDSEPRTAQWALPVGVFFAGAYGGYFGAAQGVILVGLMGVFLTIGLQDINGVKNVLATIVNAVAAVAFMVVAWDRIDWKIVALIGGGSLIGGQFGARIGRRLPPAVLRGVILVIGALALVKILFFD